MKETLKKLLPEKLFRAYRFLKDQLKFTPRDEEVYFDSASVYAGHFKVKYRGVDAIRCPFDYVIYQMIISELKPDLVIEIGAGKRGGGALYIADLMNNIGHGMVHTLGLETSVFSYEHPRVKLFNQGWENYDLKEATGFKKILVIEDASHMYEDTLEALRKFSPLVSVGSYFIVEDGIVSALGREKGYHGGPLKSIREFMQENDDFIVDRTYCDMFGKNATFNVNGYLKRVR